MKYVNNGLNGVRDYSFAFDNPYFSDCILHIELMSDSEENGDGVDATTKMFKQHPAMTSNGIFKRKRGGNRWDNNIVHGTSLTLK